MNGTALEAHPDTDLAESLGRLRTYESSYTGIVRGLHKFLAVPQSPRLTRYVADAPTVTDAQGTDDRQSGAGPDADAAAAAALGEALERFSGATVDETRLVFASANDLAPDAVDPERFALFAERQYLDPGFYFRRFNKDTKTLWIDGFALPTGRSVYLPAQLVYFRMSRKLRAREGPIGYTTSNGMACGATIEEAVVTGLLELIERDALMLTWANRLSLPRVRWSDVDSLNFERKYFSATSAAYEVMDMSGFSGVPTALAVARTRTSATPFGIGTSSAKTFDVAWRKALSEALGCPTLVLFERQRDPNAGEATRPEDVRTPVEHLMYYSSAKRVERTYFLDQSDETREVGSVPSLRGVTALDRIREIASLLRTRGIDETYAVDISTPEVKDGDLAVVKTIAPELQPIDFRYDWRFLGGSRLYKAAAAIGLSPHEFTIDELNPDPHPFP